MLHGSLSEAAGETPIHSAAQGDALRHCRAPQGIWSWTNPPEETSSRYYIPSDTLPGPGVGSWPPSPNTVPNLARSSLGAESTSHALSSRKYCPCPRAISSRALAASTGPRARGPPRGLPRRARGPAHESVLDREFPAIQALPHSPCDLQSSERSRTQRDLRVGRYSRTRRRPARQYRRLPSLGW